MTIKKEIHILGCRQEDLPLKHPNKIMRLFGFKYEYKIQYHHLNGITDTYIVKLR